MAPLDAAIAILAAKLDWSHRDPFDRLIAATAMQLKAALISSDAAFDALSMQTDWPGRLW
jgi:PIN domain nuclease of toxin-antitoxin system